MIFFKDAFSICLTRSTETFNSSDSSCKVATTKAQRKLFFKLRQNKKRLGWFTEKERENVADDLGVSPNDVAEMETRLSGQDIGFDMSADDDSDNSQLPLLAPASYLEDENSNFAKNFENRDYQT